MPLSKNKAFFLDRDGVINKEKKYITKKSQFIFMNGVKKAIKYLNKKNYLVIIITNQAGIAKGLLTEVKLKEIHDFMRIKLFQYNKSVVDDIFYCPYHKDATVQKFRKKSYDRKPNPGMLIKAIKKWNIAKGKSFMIGDQYTDFLAAKRAKIKFYFKKKCSMYTQIKKIINL